MCEVETGFSALFNDQHHFSFCNKCRRPWETFCSCHCKVDRFSFAFLRSIAINPIDEIQIENIRSFWISVFRFQLQLQMNFPGASRFDYFVLNFIIISRLFTNLEPARQQSLSAWNLNQINLDKLWIAELGQEMGQKKCFELHFKQWNLRASSWSALRLYDLSHFNAGEMMVSLIQS